MLHKSSAAVVLHCGVVIFSAFPCRERIHPFRSLTAISQRSSLFKFEPEFFQHVFGEVRLLCPAQSLIAHVVLAVNVLYSAPFKLRFREQAVYHLERAFVLALALIDVNEQRIAHHLADAECSDLAADVQRVARAAVGREVLEHLARVVVFVYRKLAQTGVRPVVRAAFGDAVRDARVNHGYSQEELADLCGMHRTYISDIERGLRNVSLENIEKISAALDTPLSVLFEQIETENA